MEQILLKEYLREKATRNNLQCTSHSSCISLVLIRSRKLVEFFLNLHIAHRDLTYTVQLNQEILNKISAYWIDTYKTT